MYVQKDDVVLFNSKHYNSQLQPIMFLPNTHVWPKVIDHCCLVNNTFV